MPKLQSYLDEETLEQIKEAFENEDFDLSDVLINTEENEYVPRERLNDKNDQIESLRDQIDQREDQLEQLKKDSQATDELRDQIESLQDKNEQLKKDFEQQMEEKTKKTEVRVALANKARNVDAVEGLLDMDEIEVKDGEEIVGLDEQIEELQESDPYLFNQEKEEDDGGAERSGAEFSGAEEELPEENPFVTNKPDQQAKLLRNNPDVARHQIKEAGLDPTDFGLKP